MTSVAASIPADLDRRFGGLARLYGTAGASRIRAAHIVVVGLGGVGSWAAEAAARSGVARLTLVDLDHIAESNINRQVHALDDTLGQAKVQAMRARIAHINPECKVGCIEEFVDAANWPEVLELGSTFDWTQLAVIDACDQVRAKTAMAAWAVKNKVTLISVGAAGGKRLAHRVDIEDLSLVTHDPLLAQMRYRLRKEHGVARIGKIGVACVFSREAVLQPAAVSAPDAQQSKQETGKEAPGDTLIQSDGSLNCHGYGSVVTVTSTFGVCATGWVLSKIAG
ncbi:tRNA threonylcarbamoyladenosine dehydratase [Polaromonas sp.]|uniref:tRNA threonylcarbamoyladenosine dehydratase n=1 Tax=Polaromonas sp. TaxID=1869339 RepID=UPI0017FC56A3|nr:tRNA threonylcarbamoyladenosine dehydratase [Polaromonas sp.]NMM04959.1 tRNA threonylcarbamoyladenosine dehydratase [Polaromonas sp.]